MVLFEEGLEGCVQERVELEGWEHPDGLWQMDIPSGFIQAEEKRKREYFPYDPSPQIVLESAEERAWITIQVFDRVLKQEEIQDAVEAIRKLMGEIYPQHKSSPVYCMKEAEIPVAWFVMEMEEMEAEHRKVLFPLRTKTRGMVLLTFTYPQEKRDKWRAILPVVLSSFQEEKKEGDILWRR